MVGSKQEQIEQVKKEMDKAWGYLIVVTSAIYGLMLLLTIWFTTYSISLGPLGNLSLEIVPISLMLVYTFASIKSVSPDKLATILFLGDPVIQVGSGPKFVPFLIASIRIDTQNYIQIVFGTPIESKEGLTQPIKDTDTGGDTYEVREPLRITASGYQSAYYGEKPASMKEEDWKKELKELERIDSIDPLGQKLTVDPLLIARFKIINHPLFIKNIGSVKNVNRQVIDTSETGLQAFAGRRTLAHIQRTLDVANDHLTERIEWLIGEPDAKTPTGKSDADRKGWWGIDLESVQIKSLGLPKRVNKAIADAAQAVSRKDETVRNAEAEKQKRILEGQGAAKAQELLLKSRAVGLSKIAEVIGEEPGKIAAQLEAMQTALSQGENKLFLVGGKFADIIESLAGAVKSTQANN